MKPLITFILGCLVMSGAYADSPKANFTVQTLDDVVPTHYVVTMTVPADHHAYLDTGADKAFIPVAFDSTNSLAKSGVVIDKLVSPKGVYDEAVKATVLREQGNFDMWLARNTAPATPTVELAIKYQLCNDLTHVCFRPQTAQTTVTLSPALLAVSITAAPAVSPVAAVEDEEFSSFMDKLLAVFEHNKNNPLMLFSLMFMAGLLSVATPCVYPMLPITSMFIIGRANGVAAKEKPHAFAYLMGMVTTYLLLGLIAGMTGGAFNAFMQSAWVNLAFALFFAFFAIALLGFYELSFMQNEVHTLDQKSSNVNGFTGTFMMGSVAGLVISPCVGPIVFALLLQVADTIAAQAAALAAHSQTLSFWQRLAISGQGSLMMGGFGIGVGLPFFLISVVKFKKLPRSGLWMNKVKIGFGLVILYFAYTYLAKGMGVLGVAPNVALSLALGLVAVWFSVVFFNVLTLLPADATPNQKMHHYCAVVTLIIGSWLVISSLGNLPIMKTASANQVMANDKTDGKAQTMGIETEAGIDWHRSFASAQKVAQQTGKPIFIDFYASWCANCLAFKAETEHNSALNSALRNNAVAVKLVDAEADFEKFRQDPNHRPLKIGLPYFAILKPNGDLLWSSTDYTATQKMIAVLTKDGVI